MKCRAMLLLILMLAQPLGAFASAWDSPPEDGEMSHCETPEAVSEMATENGVLPDTGDTHLDCDTECGLCAACASAITAMGIPGAVSPQAFTSLSVPADYLSAIKEGPYRPPAIS